MMIGAIIGDIAGSRFEGRHRCIKTKDFTLFHEYCHFTDDTSMTLALSSALLDSSDGYSDLSRQAVKSMQEWGRLYPHGYGRGFRQWLNTENPQPYNSFGNGAAMRVSGCGWAGKSLAQTRQLAYVVTAVTHNHPEGLKGAEATAAAVFLARTGSTKEEIRSYVQEHYYALDFTLEEIRPSYHFDVSCQGSVPQALEAFLEAEDFEDAIRNAISIGGDSDTIGAITGSVAEAYYGVPNELREQAISYLDIRMIKLIQRFEESFGKK